MSLNIHSFTFFLNMIQPLRIYKGGWFVILLGECISYKIFSVSHLNSVYYGYTHYFFFLSRLTFFFCIY